MAENGYVGKISHGGGQVVQAPHGGEAKKGNAVKTSGSDLRGSGK